MKDKRARQKQSVYGVTGYDVTLRGQLIWMAGWQEMGDNRSLFGGPVLHPPPCVHLPYGTDKAIVELRVCKMRRVEQPRPHNAPTLCIREVQVFYLFYFYEDENGKPKFVKN